MNDDAHDIIIAVTSAARAIAPATGPAAPFVAIAATSIEAILSLAEGLGHRDAVLASLDAAYAAAKARTDADLTAKRARRLAEQHGLDPATVSVLTPPALPLPTSRLLAAAERVRGLPERIVLDSEDREALRVVADHLAPRDGG